MSVDAYDHKTIEIKWQGIWLDTKLDSIDLFRAKKPFYNLMMFPYPSAEGMHVGNMYAMTGSDIYGRFKRMQGYDVFEPMGLDGFGIHSENYALKTGKHPMDHADRTEKSFYAQTKKIGVMVDWDRTVETYHPDYYRWTQWVFVQMFRHGLAYRNKAIVNWCPSDKTVLADEQVIDGKCERCGNIVEKRSLEQWFFRITAYAEKLLGNLRSLDWSEKIKVAQTNWIGKKEGINITYPVVDEKGKSIGDITCFTTRPDTNFGATFVVLAPEHPFISQIQKVLEKEKVATIGHYLEAANAKTENDRMAEGRKKTGIDTGLYCVNQLNGRRMPLYISDFVLMSFGTGAVVGVPGHDTRDFDFAIQFDIPIIRVVVGKDADASIISRPEQVQESEGVMVNSEFLNGLDIHQGAEKMMDFLEQKGWGKRVMTYHLRDWLISRQRYWGAPIPMIFCKKCQAEGKGERKEMPGYYTVREKDLPVLLPRIEDYKPGDDGIAPLAKHKEFYETTCPGCGGKAVRETDVSDTFLDSSWYFLRYPSVGAISSGKLPFDPEITKKWLPVDMYTGGAEHSVLHLMYSRFMTMAFRDFGFLDFEEPFTRFYAHGLVIKDGAKMSKSKGNVVNPDEYMRLYGSDALRMYLMFMGPFNQGGDFRDAAMEGMNRWVGRVWRMSQKTISKRLNSSSATIHSALQKTIKRVGDDTEKRRYNTAIAGMMEFTNFVSDHGDDLGVGDLKKFILILAPFAPHLAEEMWESIGGKYSVHQQPWPQFDASRVIDEQMQVVVQVNGRLRDALTVTKEESMNQKYIETSAKKSDKVQKFLAGNKVRKVIFVSGKLINFVV